jgi:hypothetical protein
MFTRKFLLLLICLLPYCLLTAQTTPPDTSKTTVKQKNDSGEKKVKTPADSAKDSGDNKKPATGTGGEHKTTCSTCEIEIMGWIMVFSPIILLLLAFIYVSQKMKKDGYSIASALSAGQIDETVVTGKDADGKDVSKTVKQNLGSASRTIAFFTGLAAIIIATCLTTFQGYNIVTGNNVAMNFDGLWKVLGALGIGVIPYGINVWNGNTTEK